MVKITQDQDGANNHNWQGGTSRSTIYRYAKKAVVSSGRSLRVCERCTDINKFEDYPVHHKDEDRTNNNPDNLEVICMKCHNIEHNKRKSRNALGQFV